MKDGRNKIDTSRLARNLKKLRQEANLTISGVHAATRISEDHLRRLEKIENQISPNSSTIQAFLTLYDVSYNSLTMKENAKLGAAPTFLDKFKKNNITTKAYFLSNKSIPKLLSETLKEHPQMRKGMTVSEILTLFPNARLTSKQVSNALKQLVKKNYLLREDPAGTKSVYIYKINPFKE
nr:helix-turn-helix transcriptional regulator [Litoribacter populi]